MHPIDGVGVDEVRGIFLFFLCFLRFGGFSLILLKDKGKGLQFAAKMGNFIPTPSAQTLCKTFRLNIS